LRGERNGIISEKEHKDFEEFILTGAGRFVTEVRIDFGCKSEAPILFIRTKFTLEE